MSLYRRSFLVLWQHRHAENFRLKDEESERHSRLVQVRTNKFLAPYQRA